MTITSSEPIFLNSFMDIFNIWSQSSLLALTLPFNKDALINLFRDNFAPILLGDAMRKFDAPVYRTVAIYDEDDLERVVYINHEDIIF